MQARRRLQGDATKSWPPWQCAPGCCVVKMVLLAAAGGPAAAFFATTAALSSRFVGEETGGEFLCFCVFVVEADGEVRLD